MRQKIQAVLLVLFSTLILLGCANGNASRYPYYTGIKNPRLIDPASRDDEQGQSQTDNKTDSSSEQRYNATPEPTTPRSAPYAGSRPATHNRHGYPLPDITKQSGDYYRVQKGDTLYSIAWEYGYDVREVAYWNKLRPPYTIYPSQRIRIRPAPAKSTTAVSKSKKTTRPTSTKTSKSTEKWRPSPKTHAKKPRKISWQWPTRGKIIGRYSNRESGKKGLDIAGKKGQPVYSAAGGEIVYSGSGLRGYGKLVIIKHNETYFSAYAHNNRLFVQENQTVKKGQHIADMGSSEANQAMLHFEVRRNGKPVDPLRYLPRR